MMRTRWFNPCIAIAVFIAAAGGSAQDGANSVIQQKKMAFTCLKESGLGQDEAEDFSMYLQIALTEATQWEVLDFSVTKSLLAERGGTINCPDLQCEIINGQLLGVDYMCWGSIETIGKTYSLNVQIADVSSGRLVANVSKFFKGDGKTFTGKIIPQVARMATTAITGKNPPSRDRSASVSNTSIQKLERQSQRPFGDVRGYLAYGDSGTATSQYGSSGTTGQIETTGKLAFGYLVAGRHMVPDDALRYSYQLQSYLADVGACAMLYIDEMERLMQVRGGNLQCGTARCAMNVGRLLGVDYMGYGTIRKLCGKFVIKTFIIDVEDGNQITRAERRFRGQEIIFLTEAIPQIAFKLGEILERTTLQQQR